MPLDGLMAMLHMRLSNLLGMCWAQMIFTAVDSILAGYPSRHKHFSTYRQPKILP